jgi:hypothetical protein
MSMKWINKAAPSNFIDALKRSASESGRTALLICGSHLEDQITVCSLELLFEGFGVWPAAGFKDTELTCF